MQYIGATGVGLSVPQALFPPPTATNFIPQLVGTNVISLPPGGDFLIPPGRWLINPGLYCSIQVLDPVTGMWRPVANNSDPTPVESDGVNYRVINPLGFPVAAMMNNAGSGYTTAPTVTATLGGSTWQAVVGGGVSAINLTSGGGTGFAVPPLVNIAAPPNPGVQATAVAAISGGAVTGFTIINAGAGYTSAPAVQLVPQQSDLNVSGGTTKVTVPAATSQLSFVGQVTATLLVNEGNNPLAAGTPLTFSTGAATATAIPALTITGLSVTTPGSGYSAPVAVTTFGGTITSAAAATNSAHISTGMLFPRQTTIPATIGSGNGVAVNNALIVDGGLFQQAPSVVALPGPAGASPSALAVITPTMGSVNDTVYIQAL